MNRENVTELLKNYRNYKYAVSQYERHRPRAGAGIANYDGMPGGSGAPELFFSPNSRMGDMGFTSFQDELDFQAYKAVIRDIDGGLDMLTDEEHSVVRLKWMEGMSLRDIADRKQYSVETVKRNHKRALEKLGICYRFIKVPQVNDIHTPGSQHFHHAERSGVTLL